MRNATESIALIRRDLDCLLPHDVKARTIELTRGGHRTASLSEGRGNGDLAEPALDPDDVRFIAAQVAYQRHLDEARKEVALALAEQGAILNVRRIKKIEDDDAPADDVWCSSCLRIGLFSPRADEWRAAAGNTLCRWCLQFERVHGFVPPMELLRIRAEKEAKGQRVTEKDLTSAGVILPLITGEGVQAS